MMGAHKLIGLFCLLVMVNNASAAPLDIRQVVPGFSVTTAVAGGTEGDYESTKRVSAISRAMFDIEYYNTIGDVIDLGIPRRLVKSGTSFYGVFQSGDRVNTNALAISASALNLLKNKKSANYRFWLSKHTFVEGPLTFQERRDYSIIVDDTATQVETV